MSQWRWPAAWEGQAGVLLRWPWRPDIWPQAGIDARRVMVRVAQLLREYDIPVVLQHRDEHRADPAIQRLAQESGVELWEGVYSDIWVRDTAPFWLAGEQQWRAATFRFDGWAGIDERLADEEVARQALLDRTGVSEEQYELVLEGGAIQTDGAGTLLAATGSILSRRHNLGWNQRTIERQLTALGVRKVIWLEGGLSADETGGHVDNIADFAAPGVVLLSMPDDPRHPDFTRCRAWYEQLSQATDAAGQQLEVIPVPLPLAPGLTPTEAAQITTAPGVMPRPAYMPLMASYVNYLRVENLVLYPRFDIPADAAAARVLHGALPDCTLVPVPARDLLVGGGGLHCASHLLPRLFCAGCEGKAYL